MDMKKILIYTMVISLVLMLGVPVTAAPSKASIGVNVLLKSEVTDEILKELGNHGKVLDVMYEIDALTMRVRADELPAIQALPFVQAANPDAQRKGAPLDTILATDMSNGMSTWNLDVINVTEPTGRVVSETGEGVYVAVLDTGLVDSWRQYFPQERIAEQYAMSFGGGGGLAGTVSSQPNKWEHDADSHGTHVTSTIIGYSLRGTPINGVAPKATIIPVKVLNQNGSGWSSVIARGITYVADLKKGPLADSPVVINMSLGGSALDAVEKAAIDYAIEAGVIIVASAGNAGQAGMGYPGAYEPVISVAASGWAYEFYNNISSWWYAFDVPDPAIMTDYYITDFSSVQYPGQDLDVAAPGSWIVGPYNVNNGQLSYYFLGGTSMASPHVAGLVALMAQKAPGLTASQAEEKLESTAAWIPGVGSEYQGSGIVDAPAALAALD